MSSPEVRYRLKSPVAVYVMALCFILAPLANILASMILFGVSHWWSPFNILRFVQNIGALDRCWLFLTFSAGFALLNKRKSSWLFAIFALLLTSVFNFHYGLVYSTHLAHGKYFFPALFMLSNFAVIVVLYHFRFPYLDRREAWWGVYPRFQCKLTLKNTGSSPIFSGTITNISRSGIFVENFSGPQLEMGKVLEMDVSSVSGVKGEIVRVTETGYGIEFNATREQSRAIARLVKELNIAPIGEVSLV